MDDGPQKEKQLRSLDSVTLFLVTACKVVKIIKGIYCQVKYGSKFEIKKNVKPKLNISMDKRESVCAYMCVYAQTFHCRVKLKIPAKC